MDQQEIFLDQNAEASELLREFVNQYRSMFSLRELPFVGQEQLFLTCQNDRVGLIKGRQKLCSVDWTDERLLKRFAQTSTKEIFIQALTPNKKNSSVLYDMTAGMGVDCFIASKFFTQVILVERHPIVHLLLKDGLRRAFQHDKASRFARKVTLHGMDASLAFDGIKSSRAHFPQPDVIYFDFMFMNKRSQSTKSMELLRELESMHGDETKNEGESTGQDEKNSRQDENNSRLIEEATRLVPHPRVVLKAKKTLESLTLIPKRTYAGKVVNYYVF